MVRKTPLSQDVVLNGTFRLAVVLVFLGALGLSGVAAINKAGPFDAADPTASFVGQLDIARYEYQGTDYTNPIHSPLRIGKALSHLDSTYDYDYAQVEQIEEKLKGVDRRIVLREIFARVCDGATTHTEKHVRVLRFLHRAILHNPSIQPTHRDHSPVFDPLVLLELGDGRCGHVARIAADLFLAAGYTARLVQAGGHVLTEVYYEGGWHFFDGDVFGNGETVLDQHGRIPSMAELSRTPFAVDALTSYWEPDPTNAIPTKAKAYPSYYYFARDAYCTDALVYNKLATLEESQNDVYFGWSHYNEERDAQRLLQSNLSLRRAPGAPILDNIVVEECGSAVAVSLSWDHSEDPDRDLQCYRVLISRVSRGWGYDGASTSARVAALKSRREGWAPRQYEARFNVPPSEVALLSTEQNTIRFTLPNSGSFFVSVMPCGSHGQAVGRKLFPLSEEIKIDTTSTGISIDIRSVSTNILRNPPTVGPFLSAHYW
jgi:hypothetical protein